MIWFVNKILKFTDDTQIVSKVTNENDKQIMVLQ